MRVDVLTIFPGYLAPLGLSLLGKAQREGRLSVSVHDLRHWTHDRHRTVDDSPCGGGAGMVMRPEPWGEAIDAIIESGVAGDVEGRDRPTLVIPTPAGVRFDQALAASLAQRTWLVLACGRYEGIDQRVTDHFRQRLDVLEVSIGDYVLGGGEAAALVLLETVGRLLPDVVGNPASLLEESHADTAGRPLLEYPVYTKPPSWRGLDVPPVLLSGHHDRIEQWRRQQSLRRTAQHRPDLLHRSQALTLDALETAEAAEVRLARPGDVAELYVLQRCCWLSEAQANETLDIPALEESLDDVAASLAAWTTLVVHANGRLVASVRARLGDRAVWEIGRLMVAPDLEHRGIGRWLLARIESAAPPEATSYQLFTGARSERNLRMYRRAGYRRAASGPGGRPLADEPPGVAVLTKRVGRDDFS